MLSLICCIIVSVGYSGAITNQERIVQVTAVENHSVDLPCDVTSDETQESPILAIWFKDKTKTPVFRFDLVHTTYQTARVFSNGSGASWSSDSSVARSRARPAFLLNTFPARLHLPRVLGRHAGVYRCRVDFRSAPTLNRWLRLSVIVPPSRPVLVLSTPHGQHQTLIGRTIGPINEGDPLALTCYCDAGVPTAKLSWLFDSDPVTPGQVSASQQETGGRVTSVLHLPTVSRRDQGRNVVCAAVNNNVTGAVIRSALIDMNLRPTSVHISGVSRDRPVSAGQTVVVICVARGSNPAADLSWSLNGTPVNDSYTVKVIDGGNATVSQLNLMTSYRDNGRMLRCIASHPTNKHWLLKNSIRLSVNFAPRISVSLGSALVADKIHQGADVYFECKIVANPSIYRLQWSKNGIPLETTPARNPDSSDRADRLVIGDRSLIIRNITRHASGTYTCSATNSEGSAASHSGRLTVKHVPECSAGSPRQIAVALGSSASVLCDVISEPPPLRHYWFIVTNRSKEPQTLPQRVFTSSTNNTVSFLPERRSDYGTILCFSENALGRMIKPCRFHLTTPDDRQSSLNCSVSYTKDKSSSRNPNSIYTNDYKRNRSRNGNNFQKEQEKQKNDDILITCSSSIFTSSSPSFSKTSSSLHLSSSSINTLHKRPTTNKKRFKKPTNNPLLSTPIHHQRTSMYSPPPAGPLPTLSVEVRDSRTHRLLVNATSRSLVFRVPDPAPRRALSVRVTACSAAGGTTLLQVRPRQGGSQPGPSIEEYSTISFTSLTSYVVGSLCGASLCLLVFTLIAIALVRKRRSNDNSCPNSVDKQQQQQKKQCQPSTSGNFADDTEEVNRLTQLTESGHHHLTSPISHTDSIRANSLSPRTCRLIIHQQNQGEIGMFCQNKMADTDAYSSSATHDNRIAFSFHGGTSETQTRAKYTGALASRESAFSDSCDVIGQSHGILRNTVRRDDMLGKSYISPSDHPAESWRTKFSPVTAFASNPHQLCSGSASCEEEICRLQTHRTPLLTSNHYTERTCNSSLSPRDRESVV